MCQSFPGHSSYSPFLKWTYACFQCQMSVTRSLAAESAGFVGESEITMKELFDSVGLTPYRDASRHRNSPSLYGIPPPPHPPTRLLWRRYPTTMIFFLLFWESFRSNMLKRILETLFCWPCSVPIVLCGWKLKAPHSDINVLKTKSCRSTSNLNLQFLYYSFGLSINLCRECLP